eukprot:1161695-Pelagomonas_calceolata.AAC.11
MACTSQGGWVCPPKNGLCTSCWRAAAGSQAPWKRQENKGLIGMHEGKDFMLSMLTLVMSWNFLVLAC